LLFNAGWNEQVFFSYILKKISADPSYLKRFLVVQNLKIAESTMFIFSKLFNWHPSGENHGFRNPETVL